jgi:alpha-L-fucosidase
MIRTLLPPARVNIEEGCRARTTPGRGLLPATRESIEDGVFAERAGAPAVLGSTSAPMPWGKMTTSKLPNPAASITPPMESTARMKTKSITPITRRRVLLGTLSLALALPLFGADSSDEEIMKKNAAEQAAALRQDPGGADRAGLLAARAREKIDAGLPGQRTAHPEAQWFGGASLGLFLHWGISSVHGDIDLSWPMIANMGGGTKLKPADYWKLAEGFNAAHYDPNLWLKAAREAGFDYVVLTAKHHDGFTLWPTEASEIGVRTSLPGRDLIREYIEACRANGLKVGLYYSGPDWFKAKAFMSFNYRSESGKGNSSLPPIPGRPDYDINWQSATIPDMPPDTRARIQRECRQQLTELLTRYGKIDVLWFDGGTGSDITLDEIRQLQPGVVINNRGGMPVSQGGPKFAGDYFTVEHGDQPFRPPGWWEQLRIWNSPSWGYMKKNDQRYTATASILKSLARSKAWGGSVMANSGPRPDGTMPPPYYQGMAEVRDWMKANGESIHGAAPVPESAQANVPVTTRGNIWYLHAISGHPGKLTLKPGIAVKSVQAARCLRTGEAVDYRWEHDALEVSWPVSDSKQPHDVIAVTFQSPDATKSPSR